MMSSHAGTYLDAPAHFIKGGETVGRLELDKFVGLAHVIDLSHKKPREEITPADLKDYQRKIRKGSRILLRTDWYKMAGHKSFFTDFPRVSLELPEWLAARRIALLGLESPSTNPDFKPTHKVLLGSGVILVEALVYLDKLKQDKVFFVAVPLKIRNGHGSPVRAFAIEKSTGGSRRK